MRKNILFLLFLMLSVSLFAQKDVEAVNNYEAYFKDAYQQFPKIPKGVLEAVAFTNTRFHNIDESVAESPLGIPKVWGVMGLTLDGKNYFRENLKLVASLSGYSVDEVMHNSQINILAYAKAFSVLSVEKNISSKNPADFVPILTELSEIPTGDKGNSGDFALNTQLYSIFSFLNDKKYSLLYDFPDYKIDMYKIFGDNLQILSAHRIEINENGLFDEKGNEYHSKSPLTDCPDYNVSHCSWVAADPSNYSSRNGTAITAVVIHTMQGSYAGCVSWFQNPEANASTHYVIRSSDGQITQMVHEADKAWHVRDENPYTVGYEHEGYVDEPSWYTSAMHQSSADLTLDVCNEYGINTLRVFFRDTLDDGTALDYGLHTLAGDGHCTKVAGHQHYPNNTHTDPGPYWRWDYYYRLINQGIGTTTTYTDASGTFYDTGGASGDYSNDERQLYLIQPTDADQVTLTFSSFDLEDDWDFMYIYDGDNVFAPQLGRWNTQSPGTVTSSGGSLLVEFRSDCATSAAGWVASWTSTEADTELPTTSILTTGGDWKTQDFTANFSDDDNIGVKDAYYQVIETDGQDWFANANNGFFADNFDNLQAQWIVSTGVWNVSTGALSQTDEDNSNTNIFASLNQNLSDKYLYKFVAKIEGSGANKRFGFHFFSDDATLSNRGNSYFIWFRVDDESLQFYRVEDNTFTLEKTVNNVVIPLGQWFDFKVIYDKTTGKTDVYKQDVLLGTHTFSNPHTSGDYISFRTGNCQMYIDQIKVYRSRTSSETITVGSDATNDIQVQNQNSTTLSAKVKSIARDLSGNLSDIAYFDLNVDYTTPSNIATINDGVGADVDIVTDATELSANWTASADENSDIAKYWYSIGTSVGGNDVTDWTDNGTSTSVTVAGLSLQSNTTYYFNVKAENGAGLQSSIASSDGVVLQGSVFAGFTADDIEVCEGNVVHFTNSSQNATTYEWTFEGGTPSTSTDENPVVTYTDSGVFDVSLTAHGATDDAVYDLTDYIQVFAPPVADFSVDNTVLYLPNAIANFTNLSENADNYLWNFDDGYTSTDENPAHLFTSTGFYSITLTASNSGCEDDIIVENNLITVEPQPTFIDDVENKIMISPNPFSDNFRLILDNNQSQRVYFSLFDVTGREYKLIYSENNNNFDIFVPMDLQTGVYVLQIIVGNEIFYRKIVKK